MLQILDNREEIKCLDSMKMLESIEKLGEQIEEIHSLVKKLKFPANYNKSKQIVFLGMGGSALGAHCIKSIFQEKISVPISIINDYAIPSSVNKDTLIFAVSYSGNTAETVAALKSARKKGAKIIYLTSGGILQQEGLKNKLPGLVFTTNNNPCGSPRMGLGYTVFGPLLILSQLGFVKVSSGDIKKIVQTAKKYIDEFGVAKHQEKNIAKNTAEKLLKSTVWFVGAEHLSGNVHITANQMNENAKRFGGYYLIPELNHHLLEGLKFPATNNEGLFFVFIESNLYKDNIQKRFGVTKEIVQSNNVSIATYKCEQKTPLLQMVEVLVFGSYLSFYTAIAEGVDPTAIPYVNYLKAAMKNS